VTVVHIESGLDELQRLTDLSCAAQPKSADQCIRAGQEAWKRLSSGESWNDWLLVGEALLIGRTDAMQTAHTNVPAGRRYNEDYSSWLKATKFDGIDKAVRSRLFECLKHRDAIERWRATLTTSQRLKLNHPQAVLRRWQKTLIKPTDTPIKPSPHARLTAALIASQEEVARLKLDVERNGDGDRWTPQSSADHVATVILGTFKEWKARDIARAINRGLKKKTEKGCAPS
jgi:hypothetical protein